MNQTKQMTQVRQMEIIKKIIKEDPLNNIEINCQPKFMKIAFNMGKMALKAREDGNEQKAKEILLKLSTEHLIEYIQLIVCVNSIFIYLEENNSKGLEDVFEIVTGKKYKENENAETLVYIAKVLKQFMTYL